MQVLGIETSCDETAVAIVRNSKEVLSSYIASQTDLHKMYGGVFPEIAARRHIDQILPLIELSLNRAQLSPQEIDLIAVTEGPGLMGSLLMGVVTAQGLSLAWEKPLIGINHIEAHLYSALIGGEIPPSLFPALGVVLSGGHTLLARIDSIGRYTILASSVDDAIGEAFDKVAVLLGFPYPGGPHIENLAKGGDPKSYPFRAGQVKSRPLDFSFSGIKTAVSRTIREKKKRGEFPLSEGETRDIAASFQRAALSDVVDKAMRATRTFDCHSLLLGGGVTSNEELKRLFAGAKGSLPIYWPLQPFTLDNGAMIAWLGSHLYRREAARAKIEPFPKFSLSGRAK